MIVTMKELEKGLWCPDARARAIGGPRDQVANRVIDDKEIQADGKKIFCCIGPACMAWRWVEKDVSGFCGRAGVPKEGQDDLRNSMERITEVSEKSAPHLTSIGPAGKKK